jgi:NADPH:quinone reductase-like Zn-dependent oxidoreductase
LLAPPASDGMRTLSRNAFSPYLNRPARPCGRPHLAALVDLVAQGRLQAAVDSARFVGVESVAAAVARLQSGASSGKVVVQMAAELPSEGAARL